MREPVAAKLTKSLAATGFLCLGGFEPQSGDLVPDRPSGKVKTLLLIGSTGPSLWPVLRHSTEFTDGKPDPLDRYTRRTLGDLAGEFGFGVLFPFDGPPYHPFQQWAMKCGGFSQSPLGVLAHHALGPWAGFRAALLSAIPLRELTQTSQAGPCETCEDKPCLSICPVNAVSLAGNYDVAACRNYLIETPDADCWSSCLARRACPFGTDHQQDAATARHHMKSFTGF